MIRHGNIMLEMNKLRQVRYHVPLSEVETKEIMRTFPEIKKKEFHN